MTRAEVEEFHRLAEVVYALAFPAGLSGALPQVPELRPQLESNLPELTLPPVQFESKLNLPGDWNPEMPDDDDDAPLVPPRWQDDLPAVRNRVFLVCAPPRWFQDMNALRRLAKALDTPPEPEAEQYVTRDQIAAYVHRNKDTVADWFNNDPEALEPAVEGGGGKRHEYLWSKVRPWLEKKSGRQLPECFPAIGPG
jgi:hypothetical protein